MERDDLLDIRRFVGQTTRPIVKLFIELVGLGFNGAVIALALMSQKIAGAAIKDPTAGRLKLVQKYLVLTIALACILLVAQMAPVIQSIVSSKGGPTFSGNDNQNVSVKGDNHGTITESR